MTIKDFCERYARKLVSNENDVRKLKSDFEWLVECGEMNAEYGYGAGYLTEHNATARELISLDEKFKSAVLACGRIGWYLCAEDEDEVQREMQFALA